MLLKQAAMSGYPAALSELGYCHQFGIRGFTLDKQKAFSLLSRAAKAKLVEGQDRLASLFLSELNLQSEELFTHQELKSKLVDLLEELTAKTNAVPYNQRAKDLLSNVRKEVYADTDVKTPTRSDSSMIEVQGVMYRSKTKKYHMLFVGETKVDKKGKTLAGLKRSGCTINTQVLNGAKANSNKVFYIGGSRHDNWAVPQLLYSSSEYCVPSLTNLYQATGVDCLLNSMKKGISLLFQNTTNSFTQLVEIMDREEASRVCLKALSHHLFRAGANFKLKKTSGISIYNFFKCLDNLENLGFKVLILQFENHFMLLECVSIPGNLLLWDPDPRLKHPVRLSVIEARARATISLLELGRLVQVQHLTCDISCSATTHIDHLQRKLVGF